MKIELVPTADEVRPQVLAGRTAVVFDVLRATSTMVTALAHGCRGVIPVEEVEEARRLAEKLAAQKHPVLLAGERGGQKISDFPHGNSPLEFLPEVVAGKLLVLTTSNGTRAICRAAEAANRVLVGSLLNAGAVAREIAREGRDVALICAGSEGCFSLEDALAAGLVIEEMGLKEYSSLSDLAIAALHLARAYSTEPCLAFEHSRHGRKLLELGLKEDLKWCARKNVYQIVPAVKKSNGFWLVQIDR